MDLTTDQALQRGVAAHKEGKLHDAERLYRAILQVQPHHPDANHNLGALAMSVGKVIEAIPHFRLAVEAKPQIEQFWLSYVDALIRSGGFDEAKRAAAQGEKSAVSPEKLEFFRLHLQTAGKTGKRDGNQKGKNREVPGTLGSTPSQDQIRHLLGHYQAGRLEEAEASATSLTQQFPEHPFGWMILGVVLKQTGRVRASLFPMQKSVAISPLDAEAHNNLGVVLKELGRLEEAQSSYRRAVALKLDFAEAQNNLGVVSKALGDLEEAEASYRRAITLKPDVAQVHFNLGNTLQELGKFKEAEVACMQAIALKPDFAEAHRTLTLTKKFLSPDEQFSQMRSLYLDPTISEDDRCHICFALAKASEDLKNFAEAFQFYLEGNAIRKKQLGYDRAEEKKLFGKLKESYPSITAHSLEPEVALLHAPIFIVGMPRSGTSLVEQIISSHPVVAGAGELPFVTQFGRSLALGQASIAGNTLTAFREQYLNALKQRSEAKAKVTDKMPHNFQYLGLIAATLPEAKIIHVKRDPAAVCWSNFTQYFPSNAVRYCYGLGDILHYHELYQDLIRYWHQVLPNRIYDLDYELLTENQEKETRKLIAHLELGWNNACLLPQNNMRGVATASRLQVRQEVYQGSSKKWRRYRPFLGGELDHFGSDVQ